jgi:hypothetical protein
MSEKRPHKFETLYTLFDISEGMKLSLFSFGFILLCFQSFEALEFCGAGEL